MKEALTNFILHTKETSTGLGIFEMPTGSGKTHNTMSYIFDILDGRCGEDIEKIFYLTPRKENIQGSYRMLCGFCKENGKEEYIQNDLLIITANCDKVIENIPSLPADSRLRRLESFRELELYCSCLKDSSGINPELIRTAKNTIRTKLEPAFRKELEEQVAKRYSGLSKSQKLAKIKEEYAGVIKLYPAILTSFRRVIFTTVDKFFARNNPIIENSYSFSNNSSIKNALVFIDEFDSAKTTILKDQIANCADYKLDLLQVIHGLYSFVKYHEMPRELFEMAEKNPEAGKTTRDAYDKLVNAVQATYEKNNLKYHFKAKNIDCSNYFIFHDCSTLTVADGAESKEFFIEKDDEHKLNYFVDKKIENGQSLHSLVNQLNGLVSFFVKFVVLSSNNYRKYKNSKDPLNPMELEDAITTVIRAFNIDNASSEVLKRIVLNNHGRYFKPEEKKQITYDLYQDGFQMYAFVDDSSHDLNTDIRMSFLDDTPEKFLLSLCEKARVVGISATASSKTVVTNFDTDYLSKKLGNSYWLPSDSDIDRMSTAHRERVGSISVNVDVVSVEDKPSIASCFTDSEEYRERIETKLNSYPDRTAKSRKKFDFAKSRLIKVCTAIKCFLANRDSRIMLCLCGALAKEETRQSRRNAYSLDNIRFLCDLAKEELCLQEEYEIISFESGDLQKKKDKYLEAYKSGKKVVLITSYSTAGTGLNLQIDYTDGTERANRDIDTIYVDRPTNVLTRITYDSKEIDRVAFCYERLALRENGEISYFEAKNDIKTMLKKKLEDFEEDSEIGVGMSAYASPSFNESIIAILKQAIGRISRTDGTNNDKKNIFLDEDISEFSFDSEKGKFNTQEFASVVERMSNKEHVDEEDERRLRLAKTFMINSDNKIGLILNNSREYWDVSDMETWKELRDFVLKYPTISKEKLMENRRYEKCYMQAPLGSKISQFWYARQNDDCISDISYDKKTRYYLPISEQAAHLPAIMKNKPILEHFERCGYATRFEPNDFILLPNIFNKIYKGALGEVAGKCILERHFDLKLEDINDFRVFEKFDYRVSSYKNKPISGVYVDFKYWSTITRLDNDTMVAKAEEKLKLIGAKKVFVINVAPVEGGYEIHGNSDNTVIQIPCIFQCKGAWAFEHIKPYSYVDTVLKNELGDTK